MSKGPKIRDIDYYEDLTGKTIGRLTIVSLDKDSSKRRWICVCSCGNTVAKTVAYFRYSPTPSCGCFGVERIQQQGWNNRKKNVWDQNIYSDENGSYRIGYTLNTNQPFYVDVEDFDKVKDFAWYEHHPAKHSPNFKTLMANINHRVQKMHIFLGFKHCDHIDHNELNNRRCNLRKASQKDNVRNSAIRTSNKTGFIGVNKSRRNGKPWRARIMADGKEINLGYFDNIEDAVKARLEGELKYFGAEFAPQRHLFEQYGIEVN